MKKLVLVAAVALAAGGPAYEPRPMAGSQAVSTAQEQVPAAPAARPAAV